MLNNVSYERSLFNKGIRYIAGVDEVGRGPLAGPMVVCAAILDLEKLFKLEASLTNNDVYSQITDSKKLTDKKRRAIAEKLKDEVVSYSIVEISSKELDSKGISASTQKAFFNAVSKLQTTAEHTLTDLFAIKKISRENQTNLTKGDSVSISIGAASILAKVYRDDLMDKLHKKYPVYGFNKHKGYGTAAHIAAIKQHGPCEIHRVSFEPIKSFITSR